jgi:non-ribosomal peptide synthase protein (TIGR01720 family)
LLVIHHLVVDGVSWRILLEDLHTLYEQLHLGQTVNLPAKTTSFKHWAEKLTDYAQSETIRSELDYWLAASPKSITQLPVDYHESENTEASANTVSIFLSVEETQALLQEVPQAYKTQVNDVLLTALVQTFTRWTGSESLLVDLEGHGRELIFDDVDLSRTVGWFTTLYPMLLGLPVSHDSGAALKFIKEQLRRVNNGGIGYGLLRYLNKDDEIKAKLRDMPQAELIFNYLGQMDQVFANATLFSPTLEPCGKTRSFKANRRHLLAVNGLIINNQLKIDWTYSQNIHKQATVEQLAEDFLQKLRSLIIHCQSPNVGGFTPSDFPLAEIGQTELDTAFAMVEFEGGSAI